MKRHVRNFLRARLAEVDRRLSKLWLDRRRLPAIGWRSTGTGYDYRERRLRKTREIILRRLNEE